MGYLSLRRLGMKIVIGGDTPSPKIKPVLMWFSVLLLVAVIALALYGCGDLSCLDEDSIIERELMDDEPAYYTDQPPEEGEEPAQEEALAQDTAIPGVYSNPDGSITLNGDGTYSTVNTAGNTTSGTYAVSGNLITFYQTYPSAVTSTYTIENGVIDVGEYGLFVKN
jgi:hypothetical protein